MPTPAPPLSQQVDALVASGRAGAAWEALNRLAARRDPEALYILAYWRLAGGIVARDLAASRDLFRRAGKAGHAEASRIHTAFLGNGTGGPADWPAALRLLEGRAKRDPGARAEFALIGAMRLSAQGDPTALPPEESLSERPAISCRKGLLSAAECDFLIAAAASALSPSVIVDPGTGQLVRNPVRTSDAMAFPYVGESPAIHALNRRIAMATGTEPAQGEPLQVLRYRPGQEYKPHFDALPAEANQRILTVLVYLNEEYEGGETMFVRTGLRFRGKRGDALLFRNALPDGRADELTQHAGMPVTGGEKFIATRWIRARPFVLPPPKPLLDV